MAVFLNFKHAYDGYGFAKAFPAMPGDDKLIIIGGNGGGVTGTNKDTGTTGTTCATNANGDFIDCGQIEKKTPWAIECITSYKQEFTVNGKWVGMIWCNTKEELRPAEEADKGDGTLPKNAVGGEPIGFKERFSGDEIICEVGGNNKTPCFKRYKPKDCSDYFSMSPMSLL